MDSTSHTSDCDNSAAVDKMAEEEDELQRKYNELLEKNKTLEERCQRLEKLKCEGELLAEEKKPVEDGAKLVEVEERKVEDGAKLVEERKVLKARRNSVLARLGNSGKALKFLTDQLEGRVKCPVCLEVPTSGPIYSCPQGHLVCSTCFQGPDSNCPLCRTRMSKTISLLATTVIENIEHSCKFEEEGCMVKSKVGEVEKHRQECPFRPVTCPANNICKKLVPLAHLIDHILNTCEGSFAKFAGRCKNVEGSSYTASYLDLGSLYCCMVDTFSWADKFFFLCQRKGEQCRNMYVQMLGTEEECKLYTVSLNLVDKSGQVSLRFSDSPLPIEMTEEDRKVAGLPVFDKFMKKIETSGFYSVQLDFSKSEQE